MADPDGSEGHDPAPSPRDAGPEEPPWEQPIAKTAVTPGAAGPASILDRMGAGVSRILLRDAPSDSPAPVVVARGTPVIEGRYHVLGEIARGGIGVVMKTRDVDLGRDVAMKVLRDEHVANPQVIQRFVEEAQIGGQLQHPGIVPVYELGLRADKRPFFTMKLVKGRTLAAQLAARPNLAHEQRRYIGVFEQVCNTMAYAHARGVLHRDLKPTNVMIGAFGEVQVVDWGLGKVMANSGATDGRRPKRPPAPAVQSIIATVRSGSSGSESVAGSVMGTPAYMPPEQALGDLDSVDERSDVFALGAILCEILTGAAPYVGEPGEILRKALRADLADARARMSASGADAAIVAIADRCMAPEPAGRFADAGAVGAAVAAHLASVEQRMQAAQIAVVEAREREARERQAAVQARAEAAHEKERAESARRQRRMTAAVAAAVLVTFGAVGSAWVWIEHDRTERMAETAHDVDAALAESAFNRGRAVGAADLAAAQNAMKAAKHANDLATTRGADEDVRRRTASALVDTQADAALAQEVADRVRRADRLLVKGKADEAVTLLREATALLPKCAEAHARLATAYLSQTPKRDLVGAEAAMREAVRLDPDSRVRREEYLHFLLDYVRSDDAAAAEALALVRLDPHDPTGFEAAFAVALLQGDLDAAARAARSATELDPDDAHLTTDLDAIRSALDAAKSLLAGGAMPPDFREKPWLLLEACMRTRRFTTVARLCADLGWDLSTTRFWSACGPSAIRVAILRAGLGEGTDAAEISDADRARFREVALKIYATDVWNRQGYGAGALIPPVLYRYWDVVEAPAERRATQPGGLTEAELLARLPADERAAWKDYYVTLDSILADPAKVASRGIPPTDRAYQEVLDLNNAAWRTVTRSDATADEYRAALATVEGAVKLAPGDFTILNTLGVAQYRTGAYEPALDSLTRSDRENSALWSRVGPQPSDVAFLAMSLQRLGRTGEARAALVRLHELMKNPRFNDDETQGFVKEAEDLIEGPTAQR